MAATGALTIAQAASALNLSEQRIHQLLRDGDLDGVDLPAGRRRHTPGAPRVFVDSVDRLRGNREDGHRQKTAAWNGTRALRSRAAKTPPLEQPGVAVERPTAADEVEAARAAALEMKVRLDATRDQLKQERARTRKALDVAAGLLDLLCESSHASDRLNDLADGYSDALTQVLAPQNAPMSN